MKLARSRDVDGSDSGVIPMINVVFLLLVFFMVAGSIRPGAPFDTEPPNAERSVGVTNATRIVHLDALGALALDGERLSRSELVTALSLAVEESGALTNETFPALALRADGSVQFRILQDTIDALSEAGIREVELITSPVPAVAR